MEQLPEYVQLNMIYPHGPGEVNREKQEVATDNLNGDRFVEFVKEYVQQLWVTCRNYHADHHNSVTWHGIREKLIVFLINHVRVQLCVQPMSESKENNELENWVKDLFLLWNDAIKEAERDNGLKTELIQFVNQTLQPKTVEILNRCMRFQLEDCQSPVQKLLEVKDKKPVWHHIAHKLIRKAKGIADEWWISGENTQTYSSAEEMTCCQQVRMDVLSILECLTEFRLTIPGKSLLADDATNESFIFTIAPTHQLRTATDCSSYSSNTMEKWGVNSSLLRKLDQGMRIQRGETEKFVELLKKYPTNIRYALERLSNMSGGLKRDFKEGPKLDAHLANNIWRKVGYDWCEDRFGPPPGIDEKEMKELDNMGDVDYLKRVISWDEPKQLCIMCSEEERRRSFRNNYEREDFIRGVDFASAGFYYLGEREKPRVKCAFCKIELTEWKKGDQPMEKHKVLKPDCEFVRGVAAHNLPFDELGVSVLNSKHISNLYTQDIRQLREVNLWANPKQPEYKTYQSRLKTFQRRWPEILKPLKERLADTGFYFTYEQDKVKCYYCDGFLIGWEKDDKPWLEHAKWYPKCELILQYKGFNFTARAQDYFHDWEIESYQEVYGVNPMALKKASRGEKLLHRCQGFVHFEAARQTDIQVEKLYKAYHTNGYREFRSIDDLWQRVFDIEDGNIMPQVQGSTPKDREISADDQARAASKAESEDLLKLATCVMCEERQITIQLLVCGHFIVCSVCVNGLKACPDCKEEVSEHLVPIFS